MHKGIYLSFIDIQKLTMRNYICLLVFETCIITLHCFKQSKRGCMSALLVSMIKHHRHTNPLQSVWSFPLQSALQLCRVSFFVFVYKRVFERERSCEDEPDPQDLWICLPDRQVNQLSDHMQDRVTASAAHFNVVSPHLSQAESPVTHSLVMYCEVHRPRTP